MSGCEQPCPKDSPLMIAWEEHKATDEYKNSLSWATRYIPEDDPAEMERIRLTGANPVTRALKEQYVEGSLWSAFMSGFLADKPQLGIETIARIINPEAEPDPGRPPGIWWRDALAKATAILSLLNASDAGRAR